MPDALVLTNDTWTISVYSAEPQSRDQDALDLLGSWTAAPDRVDEPATDRAREG